MFSPKIQNYINNSNQAQAYSRVNELNHYINSIYPEKEAQKPAKSAFEEILAQSKEEIQPQSVFDIDLPPNIKKESITPMPFGSLSKVPQENTMRTKDEILSYVSEMGEKYGVEEKLIKALIKQESGFNPNAVSSVGAKGLMQLMPATANYMVSKLSLDFPKLDELKKPRTNMYIGCNYLKYLKDKFNNDLYVIAAYNGGEGSVSKWLKKYNAGPGAVDKYDGVPPYKETQNYVKAVLANYL